MEVFFIKYRKLLLVASAFAFVYSLFEIYRGIESINSGGMGAGTGIFIDAVVFLFLSMYFFINVRRADKAVREENAAAEVKNNKPEV